MGLIGVIKSIERVQPAGEVSRIECTVDEGGGSLITVPVFSSAGDDSMPIVGDRVFMVDLPQSGRAAIVGFNDDQGGSSTTGERRLYSRNENGQPQATVHLKADGAVSISNGSGSIELSADGSVTINGAKITTSGDVETANGISLDQHSHKFTNADGAQSETLTAVASQ